MESLGGADAPGASFAFFGIRKATIDTFGCSPSVTLPSDRGANLSSSHKYDDLGQAPVRHPLPVLAFRARALGSCKRQHLATRRRPTLKTPSLVPLMMGSSTRASPDGL